MFDIKNIKYTRFEMIEALNEYVDSTTDEEMDIIKEVISGIIPKDTTKKEMNVRIAEYNGITVSELISSPNMEYLVENYSINIINDVYEKTIELDMTKIQATSLIYFSSTGDI